MNPTAPTFARHDALAALGRSLQAAGYRFVTVTPATHRRVNDRPGNAWAHDPRGVFGWSRPYRAGVLPDSIDGGFDLIMSNPPYILEPDELTYRHGGGTLGAGLSIRIVHAALDRLHPGGSLLLYTGVAIVDGADPFLAAVRDRLDAATDGWSYEELDPDVFGGQLGCAGYENVERIAAVWLHAMKRG